MSTVKRLFLYLITFVNLVILSVGTGTLLALLFDFPGNDVDWRGYGQGQLSIGLAMFIIGGVLWILFWRIVRKSASGKSLEQGSGIRKLYLNIVLVVSAIMGLTNLAGFLGWVFGGTPYDAFPAVNAGTIIVTGCLWWYHTRIEHAEGQPSNAAKLLRRWYIYILSAFGLVALTLNLIQIVNSSVLYLLPGGEFTVQGGLWHGVLAYQLAWVIAGGLGWWYFWFRQAKGDYESTIRQVYLYLLTITGSVVTALTALTNIFYRLLSFAFNSADGLDAAFIGWTVPAALICGGIWFYHRKLVEEESARLTLNRLSPRRFYLYLMSFIGLGTVFSGIVYLIALILGLVFDSLTTSFVFSENWWGNQLALALSLLLVGISVWLYFWRNILRITEAGGVTERSAHSRRIFLYTVLGLSIIAAVTSLVIVIYQVINGSIQGEFTEDVLRTITWSLSVFLTSVPVLWYHWKLLREDQSLGAEKIARRKRVNVIAGENAAELIERLEKELGYHVRKLHYTGDETAQPLVISEDQLQNLVMRLSEAEGGGVIIDLTGTEAKLLPYEDD
ncbi:MAG: hypothetical protein JW712_05940 [Dehalococcoidales bacterium]|nr:hypothetical protein [Dehalococcoidales bacterium]